MRLTTLGVKVGYGIETTAGTKPTTFKEFPLVESIPGITLETEQIDVSVLSDFETQYAAGRQDTGGTWDLSVQMDDQVSIPAIKTLYEESKAAQESGLGTWFEVIFPDMKDNAFFVVVETGRAISMPEIGQNSAALIPVSLIIRKFIGLDTRVEFTDGEP